MPDDALRRRLDDFQDLFVEARLCIEDAVESQETTYFDEEAEAAKEVREHLTTLLVRNRSLLLLAADYFLFLVLVPRPWTRP